MCLPSFDLRDIIPSKGVLFKVLIGEGEKHRGDVDGQVKSC